MFQRKNEEKLLEQKLAIERRKMEMEVKERERLEVRNKSMT